MYEPQENIIQGIQLPFPDEKIELFEPEYQNRFLKVFIEDKTGFAEQIIDIIFLDYFDTYQKLLLDLELKYHNQYKIRADYVELKRLVNSDKSNNPKIKEHLLGLVDKIKDTVLEHAKIQPVKDSAYEFFKEKSVKNAIFKLAHEWKNHSYDSMKTILENALKAGEPRNTGHKYFEQIEERLRKNNRAPIPVLDNLNECISGGLAPGEFGIVLAPTGGGKSMTLVKIASSAMQAGKKVVYYSLELSEKMIGQRFDALLAGVYLDTVWDFKEYITERLHELRSKGANLSIKEYPTGLPTINTIYADLESLKNLDNFVPDLIIIDYADLMKPITAYSEFRHTLTGIYESLRGLAVELQVPVWTASQTNRSAIDKDNFGLDTVGESLGKATIADLVLGVAISPESKEDKRANLMILKNRLGLAGRQFPMIFDTRLLEIAIDMKRIDETREAVKFQRNANVNRAQQINFDGIMPR